MTETIPGGAVETERLLGGIRRSRKPTMRAMGLELARRTYVDTLALLDIAPTPEVGPSVHRHESERGGFELRLSLPPGVEPRRCLVWVHGGGFCVGDAASTDALCGALAMAAGIAVVSVDYRRAPEHPLGLAIADVWQALEWSAARFPAARLALGGDSAGATLALDTLMSHDGELAERLDRLLLCYPLAAAAPTTASRQQYGSGHFLTNDDLDWFLGMATGGSAPDARVELLERRNWKPLPRTLVLLAGKDPLHDEGLQLAERLAPFAARLDTLVFPDLVHGFLHMGGFVPFVREAHARVAGFLRDEGAAA